MEALSYLHPTTSISEMDSPQQFLRLEDLHTASSPSATPEDDLGMVDSQASPPPVIIHSKPAKKRKSWGQTLPEPKTTLPPRKRAKTDDEKEQRRIERIKRNRAAAHNSRERKRQETEVLAVKCAELQAELAAYRKLHGPLPASVVLPKVTISNDEFGTPAPSIAQSHDTPQETSTSPMDTTDLAPIKEEPLDLVPTFPPAFDNLDVKSSLSQHLDPTQHSAAMLCDLQCRSSPLTTMMISTTARWWATLILTLMTSQIQACYRSLLSALWTLSPSRMERLMQASRLRLTSRSMTSSRTPLLLRSMAMAQLNAATGRPTQQGALALTRVSGSEVTRLRTAVVRPGHHCVSQRTASAEQGQGQKRERGDENEFGNS
ncbi:hypothetical protein BAUCODRAFT_77653 [Baudoinia panamericana UAMH 10762]|uniref:BZIP domain-containing protein n=1 Tax=Baudoinia panamericana (strain UAMH 10762) TaxID=717646 RepID=M2N1X1_BAUPA|nr:uncharacterized protein BAUCODRAFT_77653 [Baudoinia panamericana UAMH 10762]EMC92969.1 hypothetical protein BAUCODRAFT_77653 [Baudoinia panamericana UAMH 10762]